MKKIEKFYSVKSSPAFEDDTIFDPEDNLYNSPGNDSSLTFGYKKSKTSNTAKKRETNRKSEK